MAEKKQKVSNIERDEKKRFQGCLYKQGRLTGKVRQRIFQLSPNSDVLHYFYRKNGDIRGSIQLNSCTLTPIPHIQWANQLVSKFILFYC